MKHIAIHTPDYAKTKICGVARASRSISTPKCVGNECMAWRWFETHIRTPDGTDTVLDGTTYGFCGLAGQP